MRMQGCVRFVSDWVFRDWRLVATIDIGLYAVNSRGGTRTRTGVTPHWILSPERLPIPPLGRAIWIDLSVSSILTRCGLRTLAQTTPIHGSGHIQGTFSRALFANDS